MDARDALERTPLHAAARNNCTETVKILLENNADMELKDAIGDQPIHAAAEYGNHKYIIIIIIH